MRFSLLSMIPSLMDAMIFFWNWRLLHVHGRYVHAHSDVYALFTKSLFGHLWERSKIVSAYGSFCRKVMKSVTNLWKQNSPTLVLLSPHLGVMSSRGQSLFSAYSMRIFTVKLRASSTLLVQESHGMFLADQESNLLPSARSYCNRRQANITCFGVSSLSGQKGVSSWLNRYR